MHWTLDCVNTASGETSNFSRTQYSEESSVRALNEKEFHQPHRRSCVDGDDVLHVLQKLGTGTTVVPGNFLWSSQAVRNTAESLAARLIKMADNTFLLFTLCLSEQTYIMTSNDALVLLSLCECHISCLPFSYVYAATLS